ncbi:MAG: 50S ribosomal protein L15 [Candidatus Gastranaerophilaceae bacterium]
MTLEDLRPAEGSTSKSKRVGRGRASGHGKTCCRGNNGEGQRSGRSSKRGFEGGQMPGYRQMPKLKGFKNFNALNYAEINVSDIEALNLEEVDLDVLKSMKKAHSSSDELRVLGNGEISKAVTVKARYFTASAKEKIEKAGGKAELV